MAFAVKAVIDKVAREGRPATPGDTFLFNDPYEGGTHLNDFRLVRPVFRDGELFCWLASVGHWLDIGGNVPGGFNARATESPIRRASASRRSSSSRRACSTRTSSRSFRQQPVGALEFRRFERPAQRARPRRAPARRRARRIWRGDRVRRGLEAFTRRAEALMRENIAALPDGRFTFEDYLDNDGVTDARLTIALDMTIAGDG